MPIDTTAPSPAAGGGPSGIGAYRRGARVYRAAGWRGVLPLPSPQKHPPPPGFTGRDGVWPTDEQTTVWMRDNPTDSNLALRLDPGLVSIDVDAYEGKTGGRTLEEAERRWGPLPPTYRSSSRADDSVSGIRVYRISEGVVLQGVIAFKELDIDGIEIIQFHPRYMVTSPSIHPGTGQPYRWYAPAGPLISEGVVALPAGLCPVAGSVARGPTHRWGTVWRGDRR